MRAEGTIDGKSTRRGRRDERWNAIFCGTKEKGLVVARYTRVPELGNNIRKEILLPFIR